ncbi:hypothetical protein PENTCL1PPCAC_26908, partial [Pristionchus entomophagus]
DRRDGRGKMDDYSREEEGYDRREETYREKSKLDSTSIEGGRVKRSRLVGTDGVEEEILSLSLLDSKEDQKRGIEPVRRPRQYEPGSVEFYTALRPPVPSPPPRSPSPDYWALADRAERGTAEWLRMQILTVLNQWRTNEKKTGKFMPVEHLTKILRSYDQGRKVKTVTHHDERIRPTTGYRIDDITWIDFLRSMRDEVLLRIFEMDALTNKKYFSIFVPHDDNTKATFVEEKPYLD